MLKKCYEFLTIPKMVFLIFFISLTALTTLHDPDYYWHVKTGEYIFNHKILPHQDIFSFTMAGQPWVLHEWLFQLLLYGVFVLLGITGLKALSVALFLVPVYFTYRISKKLSSAKITASLVLVVLSPLFLPYLSPRPQLFTYIFFSYFLYGLLSFKYFSSRHHLYTFPLIMILWVNLHGGYIIGVALVLLFGATELLSNFMKPVDERKSKNALLLPFGIALLAIAASSANPDFIEHWKYPFQVISMEASKGFISEWRSPNFHGWQTKLYLLLVFTFFAANIGRKQRPDLTEICIPLFFITEGFVAIRHIPLAGLATIPFMALALNDHAPIPLPEQFKGNSNNALVKKFSRSMAKDLGHKEYFLNWTILAFSVLALYAITPALEKRAIGKVSKTIPVTAADFIVDNQIVGRMFNTYGYGGYLVYRLYPEQKVFIDGRADMYGDEFLKKYKTINNGLPDWDKEFNQYDIDYVLCRREAPIRQLLLTRGDFSLVYDDEYNSILVKKMPEFASLISNFEQSEDTRIVSQ